MLSAACCLLLHQGFTLRCIALGNALYTPWLASTGDDKEAWETGEAPEGCLSRLEVPLLLPGSQLVLKGHALRALPAAEAHVTHSQHNSPQGQVPGIVCLPCQPFSATLHCQAVNSATLQKKGGTGLSVTKQACRKEIRRESESFGNHSGSLLRQQLLIYTNFTIASRERVSSSPR